MREAAEALDHRAMPMRIVEHRRQLRRCRHEPGEEADRLVLHRQAFGMLERQVGEGAHATAAALRPGASRPARSPRRAPAHRRRTRARSPRKALRVNWSSSRMRARAPARRRRPGVELAAQRPLDGRAEALDDAAIERRVLDEPDLARAAVLGAARRAEPEVEHVLRPDRRRRRRRSSALQPLRSRSAPSARRRTTKTAPSWRFTCSCMLRLRQPGELAALLGRDAPGLDVAGARDPAAEAGPPRRRRACRRRTR